MNINQIFKNYIIIFISLTLLRLLNFESMVASCLAMILSFLIENHIKNSK